MKQEPGGRKRKRPDVVKARPERRRVDGVRVGPGRRPARSLDTDLTASHRSIPEPEPEQEVRFDWRGFARAAKLGSVERRLLAARRRGVPDYRLATELELSALRVSRAGRILDERLRDIGPQYFGLEPLKHSLRPAFREQLGSSAPVCSLSQLDETFLEIMSGERLYFVSSQPVREISEKTSRFCPVQVGALMPRTIKQMHADHERESAKLARLETRFSEVQGQIRDAIAARDALATELASDREASVLEERPFPSPVAAKKLAAAETAIEEAIALRGATQAAIATQARKVDQLAGEIEQNRHAMLGEAISSARQKAFTAMEEFVKAAVDMRDIARAHGFRAVPLDLVFPDYVPHDPFSGFSQRQYQQHLLNAAGEFHDHMSANFKAVA